MGSVKVRCRAPVHVAYVWRAVVAENHAPYLESMERKKLYISAVLVIAACGNLLFYYNQLTSPLLSKAWITAFFVAMCSIVFSSDRSVDSMIDEQILKLEHSPLGSLEKRHRTIKIVNTDIEFSI